MLNFDQNSYKFVTSDDVSLKFGMKGDGWYALDY